MNMNRFGLGILVASMLFAVPGKAQEIPGDYQEVLNFLGRHGDYKGGVLKVNVPRTYLHVRVAGVPTPTPFGFGGGVAMTNGGLGNDVLMGDFGLFQRALNR